MRGRTVAAASVALSVGLIAFILVQISSINRDGVGVGVSQASACSESEDEECLPDDLSMEDMDGHVWEPSDLAGKVVIVNLWATWCRPCLAEIPDLAQLYEDYRDRDLVLLGVMTDQPSDDEYAEFAERTRLIYPVVRATADVLRGFELPDVLPTTLVYDRGGRLVFRHQGAVTTEQMAELVDDYLAEEPPVAGHAEARAE